MDILFLVFLVSLLLKNMMGEGRGTYSSGGGGVFDIFGQGGRHLFGRRSLLERRCLFKEIQYMAWVCNQLKNK